MNEFKLWDKVLTKLFNYSDEEKWIYWHFTDWKHYIILPADEERFLNWKSYQSSIAWYSCRKQITN